MTLQERVVYNKEVQTTAIETESPDSFEQEIRIRILKEQDAEAEHAARDKELEEESIQLDKEIEEEIRGMSHKG
jgi:dynein intermediate chain